MFDLFIKKSNRGKGPKIQAPGSGSDDNSYFMMPPGEGHREEKAVTNMLDTEQISPSSKPAQTHSDTEVSTKTESMPAFKKGEDRYSHINFTPPESVASAAARGLEMRKKASPSNRGGLSTKQASSEGIGSGVQRASDLKNRKTLSPETLRRMKAFFDRHSAYKHKHREEPKGKAKQSWLLWGGDAGRSWAEKVVRQMEAADKKTVEKAVSPISTTVKDLETPPGGGNTPASTAPKKPIITPQATGKLSKMTAGVVTPGEGTKIGEAQDKTEYGSTVLISGG